MKFAVLAGSLLAFVGVAAGALGAHALKDRIQPDLYEKAVLYHLIHAVAMVLAGTAGQGRAHRAAACLFGAGVVLFSGSLYVLALDGPRWMGMVAPVGGLALMAGWVALAAGSVRA